MTLNEATTSPTFQAVVAKHEEFAANHTPIPARLSLGVLRAIRAIDLGKIKFENDATRAELIELLGLNMHQCHLVAQALALQGDLPTLH